MLQTQLVLPTVELKGGKARLFKVGGNPIVYGGAVGRVEGRPTPATLSMSRMGLADSSGVSSTHIPCTVCDCSRRTRRRYLSIGTLSVIRQRIGQAQKLARTWTAL